MTTQAIITQKSQGHGAVKGGNICLLIACLAIAALPNVSEAGKGNIPIPPYQIVQAIAQAIQSAERPIYQSKPVQTPATKKKRTASRSSRRPSPAAASNQSSAVVSTPAKPSQATGSPSAQFAGDPSSKTRRTDNKELMDWDMDQAAAERAAEMAKAVPQKPLTGKLSAIKLFLGLPQAYWEAESPHVNAKGYDELVAAGVSVPKPDAFQYRQGRYLIAVWFDKKSGLAREVSIMPEDLDEDLTLNEAKQIVASVGITKPPVKDRETDGWLKWYKQGKVSASFSDEHMVYITVERAETQTSIAPSSATTPTSTATSQQLNEELISGSDENGSVTPNPKATPVELVDWENDLPFEDESFEDEMQAAYDRGYRIGKKFFHGNRREKREAIRDLNSAVNEIIEEMDEAIDQLNED